VSLEALRAAPALTRPTARVVPWPQLGLGFLIGVGALLLGWHDEPLSPETVILLLRAGAIGLALGAAFLLDDPTEASLLGAPVPLAARRALRIGLALPAVAAMWLVILYFAGKLQLFDGGELPPVAVPGVTLEAAALVALALAVGARHGGRIASIAVLVVAAVGAAPVEGLQITLMVPAGPVPEWPPEHNIWWVPVALGAPAALLLRRR
jgi:hypothetical protein